MAGQRFASVTISARSEPLLISPLEDGMVANIAWICPPSRSVMAGAPPR
jgi:hypothetical protein